MPVTLFLGTENQFFLDNGSHGAIIAHNEAMNQMDMAD